MEAIEPPGPGRRVGSERRGSAPYGDPRIGLKLQCVPWSGSNHPASTGDLVNQSQPLDQLRLCEYMPMKALNSYLFTVALLLSSSFTCCRSQHFPTCLPGVKILNPRLSTLANTVCGFAHPLSELLHAKHPVNNYQQHGSWHLRLSGCESLSVSQGALQPGWLRVRVMVKNVKMLCCVLAAKGAHRLCVEVCVGASQADTAAAPRSCSLQHLLLQPGVNSPNCSDTANADALAAKYLPIFPPCSATTEGKIPFS